jgi:hypothetical protein
MHSIKNRLVALAILAVVGFAATGCTKHDVVLDPKGMRLTANDSHPTIGHINTQTIGVTFFFKFIMTPGPDGDGNASNTLQYTYNQMVTEASSHGASRLLDLTSEKASSSIFFPFFQMFTCTFSANMTK